MVNHQASVWNPTKRTWVLVQGLDWTGAGGAADYRAVNDEEAVRVLLRQGVGSDELAAVMLGLDPNMSPLARVLTEAHGRA